MKILFQTTYGTTIDDEPPLPQENPRLQKLVYTLWEHMFQFFDFLDKFPNFFFSDTRTSCSS